MSKLAKTLRELVLKKASGEGLAGTILPQVARRAHEIASSPNASFQEMEKLIEGDPVVAAKVIQVAASPLFHRGGTPVQSLREAVARIGFQGTRNVVFLVTMRGQVARGASKDVAAQLWKHSLATAVAAQRLSRACGQKPDTGFLCGLLHDIGRVVAYAAFEQGARRQPELRTLSEAAVLQAIDEVHAQAAGFLARRWGVSDSIVEAIEGHHGAVQPGTLAGLIALADSLASEGGWPSRIGRELPASNAVAQELQISLEVVNEVRDSLSDEVTPLLRMS